MKLLYEWLSSNGFMPHGFCYQWKPALVWLHAFSDSLIALAYFCIPAALVYFVRKRRDVPFSWMFLCFGIFIAACGMTHVMDVWTLVLSRDTESVLLEVSDTGRGISASNRKKNGTVPLAVGVGIPSMEERVKQLGGQLSIDSSNRGTTVSVTVPLHDQGK